MATFDEIKQKTAETIEQAKPVIDGAVTAGKEAASDFAEKADEWASQPHPGAEKAYEALGKAAEGAFDAVTEGANAAYEFIKDRVEEASGKDVDGDDRISNTGDAPGEYKSPVSGAAEAVAGAAGKAGIAAKNAAERLVNKDLDGDGQVG